MTLLLVLAVVLLAAALALVLSDQLLARLAERKASEYLTAPFGGPTAVRVHGEPFLTQAVRGRYRAVEVSGPQLRFGEIGGARLAADLTNVYLPLRALLGRRVTELPCEHVSGTVVIPYAELVRLARVPSLLLAHDGVRLVASLSVPIPGISSLARVGGEAKLSVTEAGSVWLRLRGVAVAGINVPSLVLKQLLPTLAFPIPLPPLPYGLRISALDATPEGLEVHGAADAVVFRRLG